MSYLTMKFYCKTQLKPVFHRYVFKTVMVFISEIKGFKLKRIKILLNNLMESLLIPVKISYFF